MEPLLAAGLEVRNHVPQLVERLQLLFDLAKHVVLGRGKAENLEARQTLERSNEV